MTGTRGYERQWVQGLLFYISVKYGFVYMNVWYEKSTGSDVFGHMICISQ